MTDSRDGESGGNLIEEAATASGVGSDFMGRRVLVALLPSGVCEFSVPPEGECRVGRSPDNDIRLDDPSVSRAHAQLTFGPDAWHVMDLDSRNGTFINGTRIAARVPQRTQLHDAIVFGTVSVQIHYVHVQAVAEEATLSEGDFDRELRAEAERCVRFGRVMGLVAVEALSEVGGEQDLAAILTRTVRPFDRMSLCGPGRIDVLLPETTKENAVAIAMRLASALDGRGIRARFGVAGYPGDAPTLESLRPAARLAMSSMTQGVGLAAKGVRALQILGKEIIAADPNMLSLFAVVERTAAIPMPVLVSGETGSGKEIVAEALHTLGPRASGPLVKVNCAALPENLIESELFGYERGAFSGADGAKQGLIEQADGGTLFLDEIGEMSIGAQAKILRVVEDGIVRRLGSLKDKRVDVRVVAATNRDLLDAVERRAFREDLYYRLSTLLLAVPPLRKRPREIVLLAERFASGAARMAGRSGIGFGPGIVEALEAYSWPGNIRELRNIISRAVVDCEGPEILLSHLPLAISTGVSSPASGSTHIEAEVSETPAGLRDDVRATERRRILEALEASGGNQSAAARRLGIARRTLVRKLSRLGISPSK